MPTTALQLKLKAKLHEKKLTRKSRFSRENRMDKIEEKLEKTKDPQEKQKLEDELKILETIQEKEEAYTGDHPDYVDNSASGGRQENNDG